MKLFSNKKKDVKNVADVVGKDVKLLLVGIALSIFVILYAVLSMRALSKEVATAFSNFGDSRNGPLVYDFEAFEAIFPGKLSELRLQIETDSSPHSMDSGQLDSQSSPEARAGEAGQATTTTTTDSGSNNQIPNSDNQGEDGLNSAPSSVDTSTSSVQAI